MKKVLIVIGVLGVLAYLFVPSIMVSVTSNSMVGYIEEFDNAPELKAELTEVVQRFTARIEEEGFEDFVNSLDEPDRLFVARSMDEIKDNGQGLREIPLTDSELRSMIRTAERILGDPDLSASGELGSHAVIEIATTDIGAFG